MALLNTKVCHWDDMNKALVTEMSQVRDAVAGKVVQVQSHKTGRVEQFDYRQTFKTDGEIDGWEFVPSDPTLNVKKLLIWND